MDLGFQKLQVPFGTPDVVTLQFIVGDKRSTNKECRQARQISLCLSQQSGPCNKCRYDASAAVVKVFL